MPGNRGERARFPKNAVNAWCWWRSACCSGTEETSLRNASAGSFFMWVSAASVWAYEVLARSACQRARRAARVWFHTTRTQPNVRFSTCCCTWSGYARHR